MSFSIFNNEMYQQDNYVKSYVWSDVILLVGNTLFCDQGCKSKSLEERRNM